MMAASRRVSIPVCGRPSDMAVIILLSTPGCQTGRGLVGFPSLRSDAVAATERETMRARQVISTCPGCAAQAVLTAALCAEIARLQAEVSRLQAQLSQTS